MKQAKTVVVKLGTSVLTAGQRKLNRARMVELVRQCAKIRAAGCRVIIVTSGAIAAGREYLEYPELPAGIAYKQMLAAVGQSKLVQLWEQLFSLYSLSTGQMLLTRADIEDRERFLNARDALFALLEYGIIPVINENDAVATSEIKVGDNDTLSALVAILAQADRLLLLTDIAGLYTANPQKFPEATLISDVFEITDTIREIAGESLSGLGTGGMATKIQAATIACSAGIEVIIANGGIEGIIETLALGKAAMPGTWFHACKHPLEERKRWIFGAPVAGEVVIDKGALNALLENGSSLLPIGITQVKGAFSRGEVVRICTTAGEDIAHGVSSYSSESLARIAGRKSHEIIEILGYEHGPVVVHRDNMILSSPG